jgi:hypothetical protein
MTLLILLGLGGISGGIALLADSSGQLLGLPAGMIENLFITNHVFPGIFLLVVMGFLPYWAWYLVWTGHRLGRAVVFAQGVILIFWILFQILLWGRPAAIQIIYLVWGLALIGMAALPHTRNYFAANREL